MYLKSFLISIIMLMCSSVSFANTTKSEAKKSTSQVENDAKSFILSCPVISSATDVFIAIDYKSTMATKTMSDLLKRGKSTAAAMYMFNTMDYFAINKKDIKTLLVSANLTRYNPQGTSIVSGVDYVIAIDLNKPYEPADYFAMATKMINRHPEFANEKTVDKKWGSNYGIMIPGQENNIFMTLINLGETLLISNNEQLFTNALAKSRKADTSFPSKHIELAANLINTKALYGAVLNFSPEMRNKLASKDEKNNESIPGIAMPADPGAPETSSKLSSIWKELSKIETLFIAGNFTKNAEISMAIKYNSEDEPANTARTISRLVKFFDKDRTLEKNDSNFIVSLKRMRFSRIKESKQSLLVTFIGGPQHLHAIYSNIARVPQLQAKVDIGRAKNTKEEEEVFVVIPTTGGNNNPFKNTKTNSSKAEIGFGSKAGGNKKK